MLKKKERNDNFVFLLFLSYYFSEKGKYHIILTVPRDSTSFLERFLEINQPDTFTKKCDTDETGIIVVTMLKSHKGFSSVDSSPEIGADIILMSDTKGVHLITLYKDNEKDLHQVEHYSKTMAAQLDKLLKACQRKGTCQRYVLVRHIVHESQRFQDINFSNPQVPVGMRPYRFDYLLDSLAVIMSTINFTLQSLSKVMHILTVDQSKLLWHEFNSHKTLFVHGAAGTGKTIIAMEVAQKLANLYGPGRVLYLCTNAPLKEEVR